MDKISVNLKNDLAKQPYQVYSSRESAKLVKKNVKQLYVDRQTGSHFFIVCSDSLFYANLNSDNIQEISHMNLPPEWKISSSDFKGFTCVDLVYPMENDWDAFEVLLGK